MVSKQLQSRGIADERVLQAMLKVPRHLFVLEDSRHQSYEDSALSLFEGQTISQPYIVAYMSEALALRAGSTVLEIGTGSGYQTAVLAEIAESVYTIEVREKLSKRAR